jgi:hypothetical protein
LAAYGWTERLTGVDQLGDTAAAGKATRTRNVATVALNRYLKVFTEFLLIEVWLNFCEFSMIASRKKIILDIWNDVTNIRGNFEAGEWPKSRKERLSMTSRG